MAAKWTTASIPSTAAATADNRRTSPRRNSKQGCAPDWQQRAAAVHQAVEHAHLVALGEEQGHEGRPDVAGATSDQDPHSSDPRLVRDRPELWRSRRASDVEPVLDNREAHHCAPVIEQALDQVGHIEALSRRECRSSVAGSSRYTPALTMNVLNRLFPQPPHSGPGALDHSVRHLELELAHGYSGVCPVLAMVTRAVPQSSPR